MLTCQLSRFHAWIEKRMEWKRSHILCMYVCTYSHTDQYNTHAFAFSMSKFRTIDTSYTLRTRARYRRIKASGFVLLELHEQILQRRFVKITRGIKSKFSPNWQLNGYLYLTNIEENIGFSILISNLSRSYIFFFILI